MLAWWVGVAVALAGCGRLGFEPTALGEDAGDATDIDSTGDIDDHLGESLAMTAGADIKLFGTDDDGATPNFGGDGTDNSLPDAGGVKIFRTMEAGGGTMRWKASNPGAGDLFGHAVAMARDGETYVAGAELEDSASRGVNGDGADNSAQDAGAAYVYTTR